ncbi:ABC transporter permease [Mesorhizobium sp. CU2]|uniref:ABC transporter permease n=1 Tax=unclassified Mesorhizobium TaxID=325217 RepID=UPI001127F029|nr:MULTISPECIES: ABC transporter permease [unclassified Mesorhizobium]TPO17061.1 ABC transporter permease [Mesorhizobium sp. CU2]
MSKAWSLEKGYRILSLPVLLFLGPAFLLPLIVVVVRSFAEPTLGLENYVYIFTSRAHIVVLINTFRTAFTVTVVTLLLGYPFAYLMSRASGLKLNMMLALVMIPFWTSVIIRTYAWISLLQQRGLVNNFLVHMGIIDAPLRLLNNQLGVHIGMVQILLPLMILPLLSTMRQLDMTKVQAAEIIGANPLQVFYYVYLPMTLPGVFAGFLLVFITALGFYVTPALMGGSRDAMVSMLIEQHVRKTLNWPLASALSATLLFMAGILFVIYERLTVQRSNRV